MERLTKILLVVLGLLVAVCGGYIALLAWYDGDRISADIRDRLARKYGVELRVESLTRSYAVRPRIRIENMQVANARRSEEALIEIDSASFRIRPWSVLVGPLTFDDIVIDGIRISVPVDDEGALYWDPLVEAMSQWWHRFDWSLHDFSVRNLHTERRHVDRSNDLLLAADAIDGTIPRPEDLVITASGVSANLETALPLRLHGTAQLENVALQRQKGDLPVTLKVSGYIGDKVLKVDAAGGNLLDGEPTERDPLRATISVGASVADIRGTMSRDDPMHLALSVVFDKPGDPEEPDLHVEMGVSDPGISWKLTDIKAQLGESSLNAAIDIDNERSRRYIGASVTVSGVEYPERENDRQSANGKEKEKEKEKEKGKGLRDVLPKGDLFSHLREFTSEFDADVTFTAEDSRLLGMPFEQITVRTVLDDGALATTIEDSKIRETSLKGSFNVTPAEGGAEVSLEAALRDAQLSAVLGRIEKLAGVTGLFDGDLSLRATGSDTAEVLDSTTGGLSLYLDNGSMPDELATRIAGDVFTAMFTNFDDNDKTRIRCAVVDFEVDRGIANARRMMMDTGEFRMYGSGKIDLKKGYVDIELVPHAKDFSLISMQLPLRIQGPLDAIKLNPDVGEGVASLLTPIELGERDEPDCSPPRMARSGQTSASD